jgi:hypothetical protein
MQRCCRGGFGELLGETASWAGAGWTSGTGRSALPHQVLKDRWPLVVALADGLATSPRTTGEEVKALINHAGASPRASSSSCSASAVARARLADFSVDLRRQRAKGSQRDWDGS